MILGAAFVLAMGASLLWLRSTRHRAWWLAGAMAVFVATFVLTKVARDVPSEAEIAARYRGGWISFNDYRRGIADADAANDIAGIAGAGAALVCTALGWTFGRVRAYDDRVREGQRREPEV